MQTNPQTLAARAEQASKYWLLPSQCDHHFVLDYLTASATLGFCRACGTPILAAALRAQGEG